MAEHNDRNEENQADDSSKRLLGKYSADAVKFAGFIAFLALTTLIGWYLVRFFGALEDSDNVITSLTLAIRDAGAMGVLVCLGLQFLQIVIAIIPGELVQAAIGLVYGTLIGGLITLAGALVSSIFVFYLVRWLGAPFVQSMLGKEGSKRSETIQRFLSDHKKLNATVFILYLIPGMPKDLFTYIVPLTPMRAEEFFVLSTIARAPAIFATTFVVAAFRNGDYIACAIVAVIFGGMGIIGILFNMKIIELVDKVVDRFHQHQEERKSGKG
ncbi:MAG: VTT domain-containing protein [Coriobacteriia bacterium]|nr:VTT domain-containing protein [Coriobacteriia bacterium]